MKKLLILSLILGGLISTVQAQGPAPSKQTAPPQFTAEQKVTMVKEAKTTQVPLLVEKAGLTEAQAGKVIEINFDIRFEAAAAFQGLNDAERSAKIAELKATKEKRYSEIPLSADQIKAVYAAYESLAPKKN